MVGRIQLKKVLAIATLASFFGISLLCVPDGVWAQRTGRNSRQGLPSRRVGGGTRGESDADRAQRASQCSSLVALSPQYLVTTTEASPTIFFCIPPLDRSQSAKLEFTLRDGRDRVVYQTTFAPVTQSGIASLKLATTNNLPELEIARNYHWTLTMTKDGDSQSDRVAQGWIRRVDMKPNLANKLAQATPLERVQLYRQASLWYEAIGELAQLKLSRPNDPEVSEQWTQLLASMNLREIAQVPLIDRTLAPEGDRSVLQGSRSQRADGFKF